MGATVKLVLRKDKMNSKGECPLHIRIIKNRVVQNISTGHKVEEKFWNKTNGRIKVSYPTSERLNAYLTKLLTEYQDAALKEETADTTISARSIKKKVTGANEINFYNIAEQVLDGYLTNNMLSNFKRSKSIIKKVKEFSGTNNLLLVDINVKFLKDYGLYFKKKYKNSTNTIQKDLSFVRRVFSVAYEDGLIEHEKNPFNKFHLEIEKTSRQHLSVEELARIAILDLENAPKLALSRDIFMFSACGGGLRISDILLLKWSDFDGRRIYFEIKKTKSQHSIPLPNPAIEIFNLYKSEGTSQNDFIFPMLNPHLSMSDNMKVYNAISSASALTNKNLKTIAKLADINKPLSTHIARHTFANHAIGKTIPVEILSKILGHANLRETQIYYKIANKQMENAMELFN